MPSTTPNFGFTYPLDTDPLADGAGDIQAFATTADTAFADLKGGTTDQLLAKNSNTDMDFKWIAMPAGAIVAVPKSGEYFGTRQHMTSGNTTKTIASNTINYVPFVVGEDMTLDRIAVYVSTAVTGTTSRLGIYKNSTTGMAPAARVLDAGTFSTSTTGLKEITISQALTAGIYWLALLNVPSNTGYYAMADSNSLLFYTTASVDYFDTNNAPINHYIQATSSLPATAGGAWNDASTPSRLAPVIAVRRA